MVDQTALDVLNARVDAYVEDICEDQRVEIEAGRLTSDDVWSEAVNIVAAEVSDPALRTEFLRVQKGILPDGGYDW